jgi:hypothetical protein
MRGRCSRVCCHGGTIAGSSWRIHVHAVVGSIAVRVSIGLGRPTTRPPFSNRRRRILHLPLLLALWTGQRQGDLLRLSWSAYDGTHIRLRQSKTGARVALPVGAPLKAALDAAKTVEPAHQLDQIILVIVVDAKEREWVSGDELTTPPRQAEKPAASQDQTREAGSDNRAGLRQPNRLV